MQSARLEHVSWLVEHLGNPGGLDLFLQHLGDYAEGVVDASRPASLGSNHLKDRQLAKAS